MLTKIQELEHFRYEVNSAFEDYLSNAEELTELIERIRNGYVKMKNELLKKYYGSTDESLFMDVYLFCLKNLEKELDEILNSFSNQN